MSFRGARGPPLPSGWEECRTETGEIYYQDHNRGVTQWERPVAAPSARSLYRGPPAAPARSGSPPLPVGWTKEVTAAGEVYFMDHNTRTSTWEDPRKASAAVARPPSRLREPVDPRGYKGEGGRAFRPEPLYGRGPPAQKPFAEDRRLEALRRQQQEIEAEKARIAAQLRAEDELQRKAHELERRRLELEREKAEVAQMKAQLSRSFSAPAPAYAPSPRVPYAAPPPPRPALKGYRVPGATRAARGVVPVLPPPRSAAAAPAPAGPLMPWVCPGCFAENTRNKFHCASCAKPRPTSQPEDPKAGEPPGPLRPLRLPKPGAPATAYAPRAELKPLKPCRYGAECSLPGCYFGHAELWPPGRKACRYGDGCLAPKCTFAHITLVSHAAPKPPKAASKGIGRVPKPRSEAELQIPEGLGPEVVGKAKELYMSGVELSQKSMELLGQLDVNSALDCLDACLRDTSPPSEKCHLLKTLIDTQLSSAIITSRVDEGPSPKRAKVE